MVVGLMVGLDDLKGLFQPEWFYDSKRTLVRVSRWICWDGRQTVVCLGNKIEIWASQFTLSLLLLDVSVAWVYNHLFVPKKETAQNIQNRVASSRLGAGFKIGYLSTSAQREWVSKWLGLFLSWNMSLHNTVMKTNIFVFLGDQINWSLIPQ